ncbi:MAG: FKBP-type peptidyl-prolyl cis-trans isomerase [Bacteroidetes bacterium]|jgi:FKBP-type peptidyl-prolyl cis-trans isomerase SlyD|nr:FKBP-type peptidyl-prolyl cis-trans isomerase [Bacteroidota bacterium]
MEKRIVAPGKFIEIEYILSEAMEDGQLGELLEECPAEQAFGFNVGSGEVLESFEKALNGLQAGEPFEVSISCIDAYGPTTEDAIVMIPKNVFEIDGEFDEENIKVGEAIPMNDEDGNEIFGIVVDVLDDEVQMDFNHPFADLDLHFSGRICDIREEA